MNPLLLIGLAVGGIYLLTRKSGSIGGDRPTSMPPQSVINDIQKIISGPGTKEEKLTLYTAYLDRASKDLTSEQMAWLRQNY